jgi:titin
MGQVSRPMAHRQPRRNHDAHQHRPDRGDGHVGSGTYNATIAVSSPTASNSPQTLNITFNVAEPIAPVTGLTATPVSGTQINLAWAGQAAAIGRYRIERKTATGSYAAIDSVPGGTLSYQNSGLNAATQYFYRIQACNTLGCSAYSAEASATTGPGAPTSLTASAVSPTQIDLTWGAAVGSITRYRIERKTGAAGTYVVIDSVPTGTLSYQNSSLPQATPFFYRVQACGTLCSAYSNEASATTGLLAPGAPPSLGATAVSASQISLSWGASSGIVTSYRIERKTGAAGTYAVIDSTAGTSYQNGGLAAGTEYFYRVQACNAGGCSPYSPEANATTFQVPPGAPPSLSAGSPADAINLSWVLRPVPWRRTRSSGRSAQAARIQ